MFIDSIEVYPTCEIHLLRSHPVPMRIIVREAFSLTGGTNLSNHDYPLSKTETLYFNTDLVNVVQHPDFIEFTPNLNTEDIGSTTGHIRYTNSTEGNPVVSEVFVRVFVHKTIDKYWIGNNQVTIHEGADDYVLSVYATFDDEETVSEEEKATVDISSHPYVTFSSADPTKVAIDDNQDKGRITGVSQTEADSPVKLQVQISGMAPEEVDAHVIPPRSTLKPIVRCLKGSGDMSQRRNMLFIAEGFPEDQKEVFDTLVYQMTTRLFNSRDNSPYNLLKDQFNIWVAFEESPEKGVTVSRPVFKSNGLPLLADLSADPFNTTAYTLTQVKDSKFGLIYGFRYGDRVSHDPNPDPLQPQNSWFLPPYGRGRALSLMFDRRRLPHHWLPYVTYDEYIDSLRLSPESKVEEGSFDNTLWKTEGKDGALVCIISNGDLGKGDNQNGGFAGIKSCAKHFQHLSNLIHPIAAHPMLDHIPQDISITYYNSPYTVSGIPILKEVNLGRFTSSFAHEFSHSFDLGDEYESNRTTLLSNVSHERERLLIDGHTNLTHFWRIKNVSNTIDLNKVIWHQWHRAKASATLTQAAQNQGNTHIQLQMSPSNAYHWHLLHNIVGQEVFLRTRDINFDHENPTNSNKYFEGPFTIDGLDQTTGEVSLQGQISKDFPVGSVIYLPQKQGSNVMSLIHPKVVSFFNDPAGNNKAPFADKKGNCNTPNQKPSSAPNIPGFSVKNQHYVVGVYEGGFNFSCQVYRPSGQCRMRNHRLDNHATPPSHPAFCAVCKYHLVNTINPDKLSDLDKEYPS